MPNSCTLAAMKQYGAELTLDNWLRWNLTDPNDPPDAELLEVIPDIFREEYCDRLRFWAEYEAKFEESPGSNPDRCAGSSL